MPNFNPLSVANEFIRLNGGAMNQMRLQKLIYFAHGWNLAVNRQPLVAATIEAWDGGPVVRRLWNHLRDYGHNAEGGLLAEPAKGTPYRAELSAEERAVIDHVWRKYGNYTGLQLSEMTHQPGTPWTNAYFRGGRNSPLSNSDILQHFTEMAIAGRQAA